MTATRKCRTRRRLNVEPLEGREVPASFGVPWSDPTHLTISFVPDGTSAAGVASGLSAALDAQMPTAVWRATILRAAQVWAQAANLNIGVVADGGDPIGSTGATQADARFGDIRIGGFPMTSDALGEAVPPDPLLAGTMAGDVFFNTAVPFTEDRLYSVALHEIGHALGMGPSTNPQSVMWNQFAGHTALAPSDVLAIRALYGRRTADPAEGFAGNGTFATSTRIVVPPNFDGGTPLVAYGRLASRADIDGFVFRNLPDYAGPVTVRVLTAGISLIAPRLSVFDGRGRLIGRVAAIGQEGGVAQFTIPATAPGRAYFLRVDGVPGSTNRVGRYGLAVTFDDRVKPVGISIDEVLRGPYDGLDPSDLHDLFEHPDRAFYNDDGGSDDSAGHADDLPAGHGPLGLVRFVATGSLGSGTDVDFYRIHAPGTGPQTGLTLVATVRSIGPNGITPVVEAFDRDQNPLPVQILVNGPGKYVVQATGVTPGRECFLRVTGSGTGNFALEAEFRARPVALHSFATGSVGPQVANYKLYAARTQLFGFLLTATGAAGSAVRMTVANAAGSTVFDLTAAAGQSVSGLSTFLAPGEYTVVITSVGTTGPVGYSVRGAVQTDPIGPQPGDSLLAPTYPDPSNPNGYLYPGDIASLDPFLWVAIGV